MGCSQVKIWKLKVDHDCKLKENFQNQNIKPSVDVQQALKVPHQARIISIIRNYNPTLNVIKELPSDMEISPRPSL